MKDGLLPVDKPAGPTSHDVVDLARRALGVRRIGHTGTLDPFASGLLLLCVGPSTRLAEYVTAMDKGYEAVARLGVATDTEDTEGAVVAQADPERVRALDRAAIEDALRAHTGRIRQVPPTFSAKKIGGVAVHRRARRGETVVLGARDVAVHELDVMGWDPPSLAFRVRCSSGTYVRALARDVGETLGVGAHLTALRRTSVGRFRVEEALPVDALGDPARVSAARIDPLRALDHLPVVRVGRDEARRLAHGQRVPLGAGEGLEGTVVVTSEGALVAIAEGAACELRPTKVFERG